MKRKILKGILFFMLGFIVFFGIRLIYGYLRYDSNGIDLYNSYQSNWQSSSYESDDFITRKNIASTKYEKKGSENKVSAPMEAPPAPEAPAASDQKYEKVGSLAASTKEFEETEKKIRELVKKYQALIQYEQKTGLPGNRWLNLTMGVPPDNFDAIVSDMKALGKLTSIQIDKIDKTNEYKELNAKKISLDKTIASLTALKTKGGKIDEYVNLEQQILDYERQLQDLGVLLGDYDEENEFCTVKYTLSEDTSIVQTIPFIQRFLVALQWTIKYYFVFVLIIGLAALGAFLILKVAQLIKLIPKSTENKEKNKH